MEQGERMRTALEAMSLLDEVEAYAASAMNVNVITPKTYYRIVSGIHLLEYNMHNQMNVQNNTYTISLSDLNAIINEGKSIAVDAANIPVNYFMVDVERILKQFLKEMFATGRKTLTNELVDNLFIAIENINKLVDEQQ